jgi:predicted Rossmann-fold nucleotide-binding protein
VTWSQLGIHSCPIILLNINGFYTPLLEWIKTAVKSGFIRPDNADIVVEANSVDEVPEKLQSYKIPDGRYRLDWTVQSPLESPKNMTNGVYTQE